MRQSVVILVMVAVLVVMVGGAWAGESFGIIPKLVNADKPKVDTRAESAPELPGTKPIMVLTLEAMSWFGPDASVGMGVTGKREIGGGWKTINGTFYVGGLVGITESGIEGSDIIAGGVLELAIGEIPAIAVLIRPTNGAVLINPGVNVTFWGKAF